MTTTRHCTSLLASALCVLAGPAAKADGVTDWNVTAGDIVVATQPPRPGAS